MTVQLSQAAPKVHRRSLPQVTLCAVSSVNIDATIQALEASFREIDFARCLLLTHIPFEIAPLGIEVVAIDRLASSKDYSDFILSRLIDHVQTSHCMIVQWDGHVRDASLWLPQFLDYDYIGASWPQFDDGNDVGNGGFSLRSKKLMELCQSPSFTNHHPEDIAIGRTNRNWLEQQGIRFAPRELANRFSVERAGELRQSFGYHGLFLMPQALGADRFWSVYQGLDEIGTLRHDFYTVLKAVVRGRGGLWRAGRVIIDRVWLTVRGWL